MVVINVINLHLLVQNQLCGLILDYRLKEIKETLNSDFRFEKHAPIIWEPLEKELGKVILVYF